MIEVVCSIESSLMQNSSHFGRSYSSIKGKYYNKYTKINWRFTTEKARIKLLRLYPAIEV